MSSIKNVIILLILVIVVGASWWVFRTPSHNGQGHQVWVCPMHTFYTSDHPGNCPICHMDLVVRAKNVSSSTTSTVAEHSKVFLTPEQMGIIGIRTTQVRTHSLVKTIRTYGYIAHDLELYDAQLEYIDAWRVYYSYLSKRPVKDEFRQDWREFYKNPSGRVQSEDFRKAQQRLIKAEYELIHMGINEDQLAQLRKVKFGQPWVQPELLFNEGNSFWVYAQITENDIGYVAQGQKAIVEVVAYQERFEGIVRAVSDIVDPTTHTVRVRIELPKAQGDLKANMQVNVFIESELNEGVIVPQDAVMDTGLHKIVFVETQHGVFEPREIKIQSIGDNGYLVKEGVKQGEVVVIDGNFLLDSESRLRTDPSDKADAPQANPTTHQGHEAISSSAGGHV